MVILCLSRHEPITAQQDELERLFPRHTLRLDSQAFADVDDILRRIQRCRADEVVIVAPLTLTAKLLERGIRPLWPDMREVPQASAKAHPDSCIPAPRGRWMEFTGFRRLVSIEMQFEELTSAKT